MTRVKSGRGRTGLLWVIGLMFLSCLQPGMAAEVQKEALIMIKIKAVRDVNGDVTGCSVEVGPRGVGACHSGTGIGVSGGDCDKFVTWRWIGTKKSYNEIVITEKTNSPLTGCFDLGNNGLSITGTGGSNQQTRSLATDANGDPPATCYPSPGAPGLWTYKVVAKHSEGEKNCEVDPGVVIER